MAEDKITDTKLSRRQFMGTAAAGAAVLGAAAGGGKLLPNMAAQQAASKAALLTPVAEGALPLSGLPSALTQSYSPPTSWDMTVDVLVVGAGGAGMSAAIEAKEAGANTLIIEKMDHWGGLYMSAGGACTIGGNNHLQIRDGVTGDSIPLWYRAEMLGADYRGAPEIVQTYVEHGDEWLAWMESLGAVWATTGQGIYPTTLASGDPSPKRGYSLAASSNYPDTNGFSWTFLMNKRVVALGIPILLNYALIGLYRQPGGPVVGAAVTCAGGTINIKTNRGVVLATGGTADNAILMHSYDPRYDSDILHDGAQPPGTPDFVQNTGDGHLAAMAVGAGLTDMSYPIFTAIHYGTHLYFVWPTQNPRNYFSHTGSSSTGLSISNFQYVICVKTDGTRYVNEMSATASITAFIGKDPLAPPPYGSGGEWPEQQFQQAWLNLPDRPRNCWAVADSVGAKALLWNTAAMASPNPLVSPALYPDANAVANDLPTLAGLMGVSPVGLVNTVNTYNGYVTAGVDPDFGKAAPQYKIATPPFYATKLVLIRHTQRNGIRVNSSAQIVDQMAAQWGQVQTLSAVPLSVNQEPVIPHLYAAGENAAVFGWRRYHNSLGAYSLWGRIAGQNAAAENPLT